MSWEAVACRQGGAQVPVYAAPRPQINDIVIKYMLVHPVSLLRMLCSVFLVHFPLEFELASFLWKSLRSI